MGFHDTTPLWTAAERTRGRESSGADAGPSRAIDDEVRERVVHLQALASSVRTRLGRGPRMKAHADDGAWAERTTVMTTLKGRESELAGAFERRRGVAASGAHGYANWDDGSLAHGELVPDLAGLLVALGGPRPHPVVGTALRCIADGKPGAGGGTWGLVFAGLLAGHAQRLRAEHDIGFAECCEHYVAASIAAEEALGEVSADIHDITRDLTDTTAIDGAIQRAMATVRAAGDFGSEESQQTEESQTPGVSAEVTTDLAALVLGFDRERFQGDVDIALAAAVLLAEGRSDDTRGRTRTFVFERWRASRRSARGSFPVCSYPSSRGTFLAVTSASRGCARLSKRGTEVWKGRRGGRSVWSTTSVSTPGSRTLGGSRTTCARR